MTIGSDLRQAREQHWLTLGEISSRTKIRVPVLRAIESDDFNHVPGGVITRGFLKLYAREVGLDPDEIARRFNALHAAAQEDRLTSASVESGVTEHRGPALAAMRSPVPAVLAVAIIVALGAVYFVWGRTARPVPPAAAVEGEAPTAAPASPLESGGDKPAAAAQAGLAPAATGGTMAAATAIPGVLRVEVHATDASWLAATADGEQVAYRVINAGEQVALNVKSVGVLRVGIPGNVRVTINGAPVKPFGVPGNPATLRITPDTYRGLLAP